MPRYGFNQAKPEVIKQARLFKAVQIIHKKPRTVFLGSSRTDLGLNPDYGGNGGASSAYNLGVLGANMYEVKRYFQHAIANQPHLDRAVLGIDFFMFNQTRGIKPDFREDRLEKNYIILQDRFNTTFSLNAIAASWATIQSNRKEPKFDPYEDNGLRNNRAYLKSELPEGSIVKGFEFSMQKFLSDPELYGNYKLSSEQLENLRSLVRLCQQSQIELEVFISPAHAVQWETIRAAQLWESFEQWKQKVAEITPFWDFSGYNSISTEALSEQMKYYLDSSHYSTAAGNLVLERLSSDRNPKVVSDFGIFVNSQNINARLQQVREEREQWVAQYPEMLEFTRKNLATTQNP